MMRLDKYLANANIGSRKEVSKLIKSGKITVNNQLIKTSNYKVDYSDEVLYEGTPIILEEFIYFMINKPSGVITSTESGPTTTVMDIIKHPQKNELFPVGRLDKDTTGLIIITNDGKRAHEWLSPKKEVGKVYEVTTLKEIQQEAIQQLEAGIDLGDFITQPARVKVINDYTIHLTIYEGKFHQIKRMMHAVNNEVIQLHRIQFASLQLDPMLNFGEYRRLTEGELNNLL